MPDQPVCSTCGAPLSDAGDETQTDPSTSTTASPDRIGPYRLVEKVGEGGMGVVWKAEQRAPERRTVAIKLVRPGFDSAQGLIGVTLLGTALFAQDLELCDLFEIARASRGALRSNGGFPAKASAAHSEELQLERVGGEILGQSGRSVRRREARPALRASSASRSVTLRRRFWRRRVRSISFL